MADYVDLTALKKTLELAGETYADDDLTLAITSASEVVDDICGRRFSIDASDTTREYVATRSSWLEIEDLAELTSIESDLNGNGDFQTWLTTDYALEPRNAPAYEAPWTSIRLPYSSTKAFEPKCTVVRVTGKFGWQAVPNTVIEATSILAARLVKRVREAPFGIAGMGADGIAVRVSREDPDVRMLLTPLQRTVRLA